MEISQLGAGSMPAGGFGGNLSNKWQLSTRPQSVLPQSERPLSLIRQMWLCLLFKCISQELVRLCVVSCWFGKRHDEHVCRLMFVYCDKRFQGLGCVRDLTVVGT